jgi:hypothetical protein
MLVPASFRVAVELDAVVRAGLGGGSPLYVAR